MADFFLNNIYLSLLLPLWIFLIIMVGRFFSVYVNKLVIKILTLFSSAFGAILSLVALLKLPSDKVLDTGFYFIQIKDFILECGIYVDRISLIFALVLFLVSFFVQIFSISYMKNEKKTYRFYALLNLFNFSMAALFFSPNLFQTYFFWELVGIVSYLLIGFDYNKEICSKASRKVFLINRIGDTALIGAIIMCSYFIYSYAPNKSLSTLSFIDMNVISTFVYAYASEPLFEILCLMFLMGCLVKSTQFPFYNWLQDAMVAKLPVSALLHSATLVILGLFLLLRLVPFFTLESTLMPIVSKIGMITSLLCSISACAQVHPKKVLAYSTSAQIGLMFWAFGGGNIKAAIVLFIAHAFIKPLLFITLPKDGEKWNYTKFILFLASGISLSGLVLSGLIAKELIANNLNTPETIYYSIISFLTAFYIIKIALVLFDEIGIEKNKISILEWISFMGLLILNLGFYIYLHMNSQYKIAEPFWAALTAWGVVYILYIKKAFWRVPLLYPLALNGFYLDKLYSVISEKIFKKSTDIVAMFDLKILSNYSFIVGSAKLGVKIVNFVEEKFMNGSVRLLANLFRTISIADLKAQNGNIQKYNLYAFLITTVVLTCLTLGYIAMVIYIGG